MLRIDCAEGSVYVHRHLVSERSQEWQEQLGTCERENDAGLSVMNTKDWKNPEGSKRRWELYISHVYGGPIWERSEEHSLEDDFLQLAIIWDDYKYNDQDPDASDAAMDAMCEIITQNADALRDPFKLMREADTFEGSDYPLELVLDFMVYGRSEKVFGKWYHAFDRLKNSFVDQELSHKFAEKAGLKRQREDMPDLLERCRYHLHRGRGQHECYLDL